MPYADAAGFVLHLHVYPGGAISASSPDPDRLKSCSTHVLKPLGFKFCLGVKTWEHENGGREVVEKLRALATRDGFRLVVEDQGGLSELPRISVAERMKRMEDDGDTPSSPLKTMRPGNVSAASPRRSPGASQDCTRPQVDAKPDQGGSARKGFRRSLASSLDLSASEAVPTTSPSAPRPAPAVAPAPAPASASSAPTLAVPEAAVPEARPACAARAAPGTADSTASFFDDICLPDDVLSDLLDASASAPPAPAPPTAQGVRSPGDQPVYLRAPGRPPCQYGLNCYRKSQTHWCATCGRMIAPWALPSRAPATRRNQTLAGWTSTIRRRTRFSTRAWVRQSMPLREERLRVRSSSTDHHIPVVLAAVRQFSVFSGN